MLILNAFTFDKVDQMKNQCYSRLLDILWVSVGYKDWHGDVIYFLLEERIQEIVCVLRHVAPQ